MDARIWLTGEEGEPRSVAISGERTVVGRDPEADIHIEDEAVSWNHLEIESRGGVLMATDLDSRNGTALNGEPLDRPRRLRDGDTLIVGGHRLELSDPLPGRAGRDRRRGEPSVALTEEERATASALVAPYRSEGAFAGRPATRAEIADALHVSERTAQRRLEALAAKLDVPGDSGRERPRLVAARVIELGLDRRADGRTSLPPEGKSGRGRAALARTGPNASRRGAPLSFAGTPPRSKIGEQSQIAGRKDSHVQHSSLTDQAQLIQLRLPGSGPGGGRGAPDSERRVRRLLRRSRRLLAGGDQDGHGSRQRRRRQTRQRSGQRHRRQPVKDKDGKVETRDKTTVKTTVEGGLVAVKDGHLNQLTEDPTDTEPSFSPDSRAIVFSRAGDVFSVRADGSGLRRVTSGAELDSAPSVAPNGKYVLFERRANEGAPADLYTVSLNGGATKALTSSPDDDHEASFSADGKLIVFVHSVAETGGGTADDLYSVRPSGAGLTRLTKTGRVDEWDPRYFAGGIVYSRGQSGEDASAFADIYTMRRDGRKARALVAGAGSAYVEDVSPDGHTAALPAGPGPLGEEDRPRRARAS